MGGRHSANRKASSDGPHRVDPVRGGGPVGSPEGASGGYRPDEYEAVVQQHRAALLAYALGLTRGDRQHAEDIVKETLYRVARDPARLIQRAPSARAWMTVIARGVFDEQHRHRIGPPAGPPAGLPAGLPAAGADPAGATTVLRAMDNLAGVHREILIDLFYRGTSLQDAAAARGIPVETVKSRLYYAMRALRAVLDQQAP